MKGDAILGPKSGIGKSIVVEGELVIGEDTIIGNCVDARGSIYIARGVTIGVAEGGGGLVSGRTVYIEPGALGKTKIYAVEGVKVVDSIKQVLPERLR